MKDGMLYADRLKKAYAKIRRSVSGADGLEQSDPIRCLALGIIGSDFGPHRAERQVNRAMGNVVDWNEIRVSNAQEVAALLGDHSAESIHRCQHLIDALQAIYDRENKLSLDRLKSMGRREARQYLESLKGVDEYAVAYVVLWCFGGHAIPVWNQLLGSLRQADLVHPTATRAEIQAFLERNVSAADARAFFMAVELLGGKKLTTGGRKSSTAKSKKREAAR